MCEPHHHLDGVGALAGMLAKQTFEDLAVLKELLESRVVVPIID